MNNMQDKRNIIIGILIIALVFLVIFMFAKPTAEAPVSEEMATTTPEATGEVMEETAGPSVAKPAPKSSSSGLPLRAPNGSYYVYYTTSGFSPNVLTIKQGETVIFVNKTDTAMRVMSNDHPDHLKYSELNMSKTVGIGGQYPLSFLKVGVWGYHNETALYYAGTIIVNP